MSNAGDLGSSVPAEGLEAAARARQTHHCSQVASSRDALELLGVFEPAAAACFSATCLSHSLPLLHGLSLRLSVVEHLDAGHGWNPSPLQSDNVFPPMLTLFSSPSPCTALLTALLHILSILTY